MPILISNNVSYAVSKAAQCIENPNLNWGVLAEEIPSDIGRTYQSYKRGGFLEGLERFRRETLSAAVWLFGIPVFNKLGNLFFEKVKHIPVDMDYADETIEATVKFLKENKNPKNLDVSELLKYKSPDFKLMEGTSQDLIKSIKRCKTFSTVGAVILNCAMMGVVIPKFNQFLTKRKINKINSKKTAIKNTSIDEFQKNTSKNISFKGAGMLPPIKDIIKSVPFLVENNSTFRLVATDVPTLSGRTATSRNKYEAMENLIIDGGSIYFYNFCANNVRDLLCSKTKIPMINPMVSNMFVNMDKDAIKDAMDKIKDGGKMAVDEIFDKDVANKIYDYSTFGKYTKINRYVNPKQKEAIDNQVYNFLKTLSDKTGFSQTKDFSADEFKRLTKQYNIKSAGFKALGLVTAVIGLSVFLPKLAFKITTCLTGKNEFTGIANFDDKDKNVKKS